jgi:hypothetical protein
LAGKFPEMRRPFGEHGSTRKCEHTDTVDKKFREVGFRKWTTLNYSRINSNKLDAVNIF